MDNPNCPGFDGTAFGDFVPFTCCDLGAVIMIEFRVVDAAGNANTCMVEAEVQAKLNPIIICKPDVDVNCDNAILDEIVVGQELPASALVVTGSALGTDNCSVTVTNNVIGNTIDDCGNGQITIAWTARDLSLIHI